MGQAQSQDEPSAPTTPNISRSTVPGPPKSPSEEVSAELGEVRETLAEFLSDIGSLEFSRDTLQEMLNKDRAEQEHILSRVKGVCEKRISTLQKLCDEFRQQASTANKEVGTLKMKMEAAHIAHVEEMKSAVAKTTEDLETKHTNILESTKDVMQSTISANAAHHKAEIDAARGKINTLEVELDRLRKKVDKQDTDMLTQLSQLRRENMQLQSELTNREEAEAQRLGSMGSGISQKDVEISNLRAALAKSEAGLAEATKGNEAAAREVRQFKLLLYKEINRITPSKSSKKRRIDEASEVVVVDDVIEGDLALNGDNDNDNDNDTSVVTPRSLRRRNTMDVTAEEGGEYLAKHAIAVCIDHEKEHIAVQNVSDKVVDISGWKLALRVAKKDYKFGKGVHVDAGSVLTVWCGKNNENRRFDKRNLWWGRTKALANRDEEVVLTDLTGVNTPESHVRSPSMAQ